jgi:hypothetical protein
VTHHEVADRRGMEDRLHRLCGQRLEFGVQVGGRSERLDSSRQTRSGPGGLMANQQSDPVLAERQEIGEFGSQLTGGKVGEPPYFIQRFVGRPSSDNAVHRAQNLPLSLPALAIGWIYQSRGFWGIGETQFLAIPL